MERLTIREVIEHCNRHTERVESHSSRMQLEETPIGNSDFMKQYWEHRQVAEWLKELQAFKDKQEQGLLLELPVKIGEVIYSVECGEIVSDSLYAVNKDNKGLWAINQYGGIIGRFGHTVFATRSEAEEALTKMERDSV